jgi:membrane-associated protein
MSQWLDPKFIVETLGLVGTVAIVFAESGLFFGFFLPGDSLLFTAGLLSSQDLISLPWLLILCFVAAVLGDNVGYWFGKRIGPKLFCKEDSFFWNKNHIERSQAFFERYGKKAIILARFMPIIRTFTPILAGVGRMDHKTFLRYNIIGGFLWVFGITLLGYFFGTLIPDPDRYLLPVIVVIIIASFLPGIFEILKARKNK